MSFDIPMLVHIHQSDQEDVSSKEEEEEEEE